MNFIRLVIAFVVQNHRKQAFQYNRVLNRAELPTNVADASVQWCVYKGAVASLQVLQIRTNPLFDPL